MNLNNLESLQIHIIPQWKSNHYLYSIQGLTLQSINLFFLPCYQTHCHITLKLKWTNSSSVNNQFIISTPETIIMRATVEVNIVKLVLIDNNQLSKLVIIGDTVLIAITCILPSGFLCAEDRVSAGQLLVFLKVRCIILEPI